MLENVISLVKYTAFVEKNNKTITDKMKKYNKTIVTIIGCGGIITQPTELKPLMHGEEYFGRMNCTWIIKAPQGKSALVRFEKFILEFSTK